MFVAGVRRVAGGARQGRPATTAFGLALAIVGYARSRRGPGKELIYTRNLKAGETLKIRFSKDADGAAVVEAGDAGGRARGGGQRIR